MNLITSLSLFLLTLSSVGSVRKDCYLVGCAGGYSGCDFGLLVQFVLESTVVVSTR